MSDSLALLSAVEDCEPGSIGKQKPADQRVYERFSDIAGRFPSRIQACQKVSPRVEISLWLSCWFVANFGTEHSSSRPFSLLDPLLCKRLDRRWPVEPLSSRITEVDPA